MITTSYPDIISNLTNADKDAIVDHLTRLNTGDRYLRFFAVLNDFALEKYVLETIDLVDDVGFGIFNGKKLIAFAHLSPSADNKAAEIGISVDADARGKGLAARLVNRIVVYAKANNISTLYMSCLRENKIMQKIAKKAGMEVVVDHDEAIAKLHLEEKPFMQLVATSKEFTYQHISLYDKCFRQNALFVDALLNGK